MELSFSKKAKLEAIDNLKYPQKVCCKHSFAKGYFYGCVKCDGFTHIKVQPDVIKSVKLIKKILTDIGIESYVVTTKKDENKVLDVLYITEDENIRKLGEIQVGKFLCEKCFNYFATAVFIKDATISDPNKEYQLEFVLSDEEKASKLMIMFYKRGFTFKISQRRKDYVIYCKNSEVIEDFLATIGAQSTCLEIMSCKVVKDIRNKVNRITNCETANIAKSSKASKNHIDAINIIIQNGNYEFLDDELKYVAKIKLENPELSLSELASISNPPMTKSSLNRKLKKIIDISKIEEANE